MLSRDVLVLNRSFQPIHVTDVRRAFTLLYQGVARVIGPDCALFDFESWAELSRDYGGSDVVRTVSQAVRVPHVIMLQLYDRLPRAKVRFSRLNIYLRDGSRCQYCGAVAGAAELNLDHVVPRSRGGRTAWENVVCCCLPCNLQKGARTPAEAGMRLLKAPVRPPWSPRFRLRPNGSGARVLPREWLPFLGGVDASYWNTELLAD